MTSAALRPPLFDVHASLATVLDWEGLPGVLRRALTRAIPQELRERVTFIDSLRSADPRLREWQVGLLALDIGIDLHDARDNLIGLFSQAELDTAPITRFCIHGVGPRQGFGASFRAPTPPAPPIVCAAAFVYFTDTGLVDSEFVFMAGPSVPITQVPVAMLRAEHLDDAQVERAIGSVSEHLAAFGHQAETSAIVLKEALMECLKSIGPTPREQQW